MDNQTCKTLIMTRQFLLILVNMPLYFVKLLFWLPYKW